MSAVHPEIYARLGRTRISLAAALAAMTGHILAACSLRPETFVLGAGVFLLSSGASALNQYQERHTDAAMERTRTRPLPAGEITGLNAVMFAAICFVSGLIALFLSGGAVVFSGGLFAVVWYNGLYTCLKRKTAYAFLPGALVGLVPPALGWATAGGGFSGPLLALCLFFYLWQVPHFWLCAALYGKEYSRAGLPSVASVFSAQQLSRIIFIWLMALAVSSLFFIPLGLAMQWPVKYLMVTVAGWLIVRGLGLLGSRDCNTRYKTVLGSVNLYVIIVMSLLAADRVLFLP